MRQLSSKSLLIVAGASLLAISAMLPQLALSQTSGQTPSPTTPGQTPGRRLPSSLQTPASSSRTRAFRLITIQGRVVNIQGQTASVRTKGGMFEVDISKARFETASAEPTQHILKLDEDVVVTGLVPHSSTTSVSTAPVRSFNAAIIQVRESVSDTNK